MGNQSTKCNVNANVTRLDLPTMSFLKYMQSQSFVTMRNGQFSLDGFYIKIDSMPKRGVKGTGQLIADGALEFKFTVQASTLLCTSTQGRMQNFTITLNYDGSEVESLTIRCYGENEQLKVWEFGREDYEEPEEPLELLDQTCYFGIAEAVF